MKNDKTNKKKDKSKVKNVLKQILNITCYIISALSVFLLVLVGISQCSSKDHAEFKHSKNYLNEETPIELTFEPITFDYGSSSTMTGNRTLFNGSFTHYFLVDIKNVDDFVFTISNTTSNSYITIYTGSTAYPVNDGYFTNTITSIYFSNDTLKTTWNRTGPSAPQYTYNSLLYGHTLFLVGICTEGSSQTILNSFSYSSIDNFYRYCTYIGYGSNSVSPSSLTHEQMETFYNYCYSHRYTNYINLEKGSLYILNPAYDFTSVINFSTSMHLAGYRTDTMQRYDNSYDLDIRSIHYENDGLYLTTGSYYFYNGVYQYYEYGVGLATKQERFGQNYFTTNYYCKGDTTGSPWVYYYETPIFNFSEMFPIQDGVDFSTAFLRIDVFGNLLYSGNFNIGFQNLNKCYAQGFYGDFDLDHNILSFFSEYSSIFYNNKPFKAFAGYGRASFFDQLTGRYIAGYSYYPSANWLNFDDGDLYNLGVSTSAITNVGFVGFTQINVNDFYFFINSGLANLQLQANFEMPSGSGNVATTSILQGVSSVFDIMALSFDGIGNMLKIQISPGLTIGTLAFVPLAIGILFTLIWFFKR